MAKTFEMFGQKGTQDVRKVIQLTVPFYAETLTEIFGVGKETAPELGLKEVGRKFAALEGGGFHVDVDYEGVYASDGQDPKENASAEFDVSYGEEPIESHPNIAQIKKDYGGVETANGIVFPAKMPSGTAAGLGLPGGFGDDSDAPNPMFNCKTYLVLKCIFRRCYASREFPQDILAKVNTVADELPGEKFPTPEGHNWLFMPPKIRERGNVFEVEEEYLMSRKGGWPVAVYGLIDAT